MEDPNQPDFGISSDGIYQNKLGSGILEEEINTYNVP